MEHEEENNADNSVEASPVPVSPQITSLNTLKPKPKISKKPRKGSSVETNKSADSEQGQGAKSKNEINTPVSGKERNSAGEGEKGNLMTSKLNKKRVSDVEQNEQATEKVDGSPEKLHDQEDNANHGTLEKSGISKKHNNVDNAAEDSSVPASSKKRSLKTLKPKPKILKKSLNGNSVETDKPIDSQQDQGEQSENKTSMSVVSKESNSAGKGEEENLMTGKHKRKNVSSIEQSKKGQQNDHAEEVVDGLRKKHQSQKAVEKHGILEKSGINKMSKEKLDGDSGKNRQNNNEREKLGGLIFMCSTKTKPDCFRYHVMGVTMSKKDLVLGVEPGLKLFLYDFDLRIMYGIYRASSCGGIKLEPAAFGGAFPVQVRFCVLQDCYPLPESVFKKAIKENYNGKKFRTELTVEQARKLTELFRPSGVLSKSPSSLERGREPQSHLYSKSPSSLERGREAQSHLCRKPYARDPDEVRRSLVASHENGRHLSFRELPLTEKKGHSENYFPSEKEYRAYGLHRERFNHTPPTSFEAAASEHHPRDYKMDYVSRHPPSIYNRGIAPPRGEPSLQPLLNGGEYQTYAASVEQGLYHRVPTVNPAVATSETFPKPFYYSSQFAASSMDPYAATSGTEEALYGPSLGANQRNLSY